LARGPALWVALPEAFESLNAHRQHRQLPADQFADDGGAEILLPPALGLPVVHDEVRVAQLARGAEIENQAIDPAIESDRRVAQRAVGDGDRHIAHGIVDDLVPREDPQRVGPRLAGQGERDDRLGRREVYDLADRLEARRVDRRNAILGRAARADFRQVDVALREVGARPFQTPGLDVRPRRQGRQHEVQHNSRQPCRRKGPAER
jgi:hypothetical protein